MSKAAELASLIGNINAGGGRTNRNFIINGAMNVAQRATSATGLGGSGAYDGFNTCDRWGTYFNTSGALTMSQDSSAPDGFGKSLKFACTTADTSVAAGEYGFLTQRKEGQKLQRFLKGTPDAKPFAVSFYVKGNASATYVCELWDNDNSRQISKTFTVGTDWSRVELSFPPDTTGAFDNDNARSFDFRIWLHAGSTYTSGSISSNAWISNSNNRVGSGTTSILDSTSRTFFLTGVQLEVGQNPTEFEHEPFEVTLRKCQRYYQKTFVYAQKAEHDPALTGGTISGPAHSDAAYKNICQWWFQEVMRSTPTITTYNPYFTNGNWAKSGYDGPTSGLYSSSEKMCAIRDNGGGAYNTNLQIHAAAESEIPS